MNLTLLTPVFELKYPAIRREAMSRRVLHRVKVETTAGGMVLTRKVFR